LCADTGSDSKPYADAGYDVRLVGSDIGVENYNPPENVYGIFSNPVCTHFSFARQKHRKEGDELKGLWMVKECQRIIQKASPQFWVIENPATGKLKQFLGKPSMVYEPWNYGSPWTKKTALWGKFKAPLPKYLHWEDVPKNENLYVRPGRGKPSMAFLHKSAIKSIEEFSCFSVDSDMEFRSLCSQKFAQAFFDNNNCGVYI